MRTVKTLALASCVAFVGCFGECTVEDSVDLDHSVELDLNQDCTGDNSRVERAGEVDYCVVTVDWTGPLLSFESIKDDVVKKADDHNLDINDVYIDQLLLARLNATLTANGTPFSLSNPSAESSVNATLSLGDAPVFFAYTQRGTGPEFSLTAITHEGEPLAIDRSINRDATEAFLNDTAVPGNIAFELRVPLDDLRAALASQPGPYRVQLSATFDIVAKAPAPLLPF